MDENLGVERGERAGAERALLFGVVGEVGGVRAWRCYMYEGGPSSSYFRLCLELSGHLEREQGLSSFSLCCRGNQTGSPAGLAHTRPSPLLPWMRGDSRAHGMLPPLEPDFSVLLKSRTDTEKEHEIMDGHQACLHDAEESQHSTDSLET